MKREKRQVDVKRNKKSFKKRRKKDWNVSSNVKRKRKKRQRTVIVEI